MSGPYQNYMIANYISDILENVSIMAALDKASISQCRVARDTARPLDTHQWNHTIAWYHTPIAITYIALLHIRHIPRQPIDYYSFRVTRHSTQMVPR